MGEKKTKESRMKEAKRKERMVKEFVQKENNHKESKKKELKSKERTAKEVKNKERASKEKKGKTPKTLPEDCIKALRKSMDETAKEVANLQTMLYNLPDGSKCKTDDAQCRCMVKAAVQKQLQIANQLTTSRKEAMLRNTRVICMDKAKITPMSTAQQQLALARCKRITMDDLSLAKYKKLLTLKPTKLTPKTASTVCK